MDKYITKLFSQTQIIDNETLPKYSHSDIKTEIVNELLNTNCIDILLLVRELVKRDSAKCHASLRYQKKYPERCKV